MKKLNTKGFGIIQIILLLVAATAITGTGYYVYKTQQDSKMESTQHLSDEPSDCESASCINEEKPVIYLYPATKQDVTVRLDYKGELVSTYPDYDYGINGWQVNASPDGTLINKADGKEYSYLFWDGVDQTDYDLSTGFVVKGSDTKEFLQAKLSAIGLTPKEYNEMIVYWLPRMEHNNYNLIHFAGDSYTKNAKLTITPEPDSVLRVFMVFKPLEEYVELQQQDFPSFKRQGFTVVEWGGREER